MEDPGTLWLLHWALLSPPSRLPVWWLVFHEYHPVEFADQDLEVAISGQLDAVSEWARPHPSSVKKDISALLRTYAPAEVSGRAGMDDVLDCPLRELGLIQRSPATGRYRFTLGQKPSLPPSIVAYAVLDYLARAGSGGSTVTLSHLAHEVGGPGRAFRLSEPELLAMLEPVVDRTRHLKLAAPAGAIQLSWSAAAERVAVEVLDNYYGTEHTQGFEAGHGADKPIDDDLIEEMGVGRQANEKMRALLLRTAVR
jgi:hypothetical protein